MSDVAPLDDEVRADALDVLNDLLEWHLAPQRWHRMGAHPE